MKTKEDRLTPVKGLGAALQSKILQGIEIRRHGEGQRHLHRDAAEFAGHAVAYERTKILALRQRNC